MSSIAIYVTGSGLLAHVHPTRNLDAAVRAYEATTGSEQERVYELFDGVEALVVTIDGEVPETLSALRASDEDYYIVETGLKAWKAERHMTVTIYGEGNLNHVDQPTLPELGSYHSQDHDLSSRAERDARASELFSEARSFLWSNPKLRAGDYRVTVTDYGWDDDNAEVVREDVIAVRHDEGNEAA